MIYSLCIVLACFDFGTLFADAQSQGFVPFIDAAFKHNLNTAERTYRQLDSTVTITKSTTVTFACAQIVNVTGSCRRRRGYWAEEPVVLTFDEATDKLTEILFTPVYSIETTELHRKTVNKRAAGGTVANGQLASSLSSSPNVPFHPRIYFKPLFNFIGNLIAAFLPISKPSSTSATQQSSLSTSIIQSDAIIPPIFTATQEYWVTMTTLNTFFVQHCTPSPFPFSECLSFRRYSQVLVH